MFCYFNMVFILELLESLKDENGSVSLISLINGLLTGFCKATGNFNNIAVLKPKKGDIVFFASWMPHRVRPVTLGTRRSIVSWILGKK